MRAISLFFLFTCVTVQAQSSAELSLRITPEKQSYKTGETVHVRVAMNNRSNQVICFPKPSQAAFFGPTGSLITTGRPTGDPEYQVFISHVDGGGKAGKDLDVAIQNDWVILKPGETHTTPPAEALVRLDQGGTWILEAKYSPVEGSFSRTYTSEVASAALRHNCTLPKIETTAPPIRIQVIASR